MMRSFLISFFLLLSSFCFADSHCPTLVEVEPGLLAAAWYGSSTSTEVRCNRDSQGEMAIWFSTYSGEWSAPRQLAGSKSWNPVLFSPEAGSLLLFYKVGESPRNWTGVVLRSGDGGATWSDPEKLPSGAIGPTRNRPLVLPSGVWISGSSWEGEGKKAECWIEISRDRGESWEQIGPIRKPDGSFGLIQPALFATEGGLSLLARDRASYDGRVGFLWSATSSDGGESWSLPTPTSLPCPDQPVDVIRLRDGRLLLAYNNSFSRRTNLTLALSDDEGKSWRRWCLIESGACNACYPSLVQAGDGTIHLLYSYSDVEGGEREIRHWRMGSR